MWPFKQKPDAGVLDMPGEYVAAKKPIKLGTPQHFSPLYVCPGDSIQFTLKEHGLFADRVHHTSAPIPFKKSMAIDTMIPLEVIDEFGLDVGVGCLCGQAKR